MKKAFILITTFSLMCCALVSCGKKETSDTSTENWTSTEIAEESSETITEEPSESEVVSAETVTDKSNLQQTSESEQYSQTEAIEPDTEVDSYVKNGKVTIEEFVQRFNNLGETVCASFDDNTKSALKLSDEKKVSDTHYTYTYGNGKFTFSLRTKEGYISDIIVMTDCSNANDMEYAGNLCFLTYAAYKNFKDYLEYYDFVNEFYKNAVISNNDESSIQYTYTKDNAVFNMRHSGTYKYYIVSLVIEF
ncbi:MAG: hypothetical protein ACI4J2_08945 [Ruminococcus sp.]